MPKVNRFATSLTFSLRRILLSVGCLAAATQVARAELLVLQSASSGTGRAAVQRIDTRTGNPSTTFGANNESLYAMTVSRQNDVFVSANLLGYGLIQRFTADGRFIGIVAEMPETDFRALAVGPDGDIYAIASVGDDLDSVVRHHRILRVKADGSSSSLFIAAGTGGLTAPTALAFGRDGNLYIADAQRGILRFAANTGAFVDVFAQLGRGGLDTIGGLAFGADNHLYVSTANSVLRFDPRGQYIEIFVSPAAGGLNGARGLAFALDGSLHVCSSGSNAVLRFDGHTGDFIGSAVTPGLRAPIAVAFTMEVAAGGRSLASR